MDFLTHIDTISMGMHIVKTLGLLAVCWSIFHVFVSSTGTIQQQFSSKYSFMNNNKVSHRLDIDHR